MLTFQDIVNNEEIHTYIESADASLIALGYTEHSFAHVRRVAKNAGMILRELGYDEHTINLAQIAAYMHDIGNMVNREGHSQSGAVMAFQILHRLGMEAADLGRIVSAIGNHDEGSGVAVSEIASALIIADKSDVRRSRVRNPESIKFDIHDRVNYSVRDSELNVDAAKKEISLLLTIDISVGSVMDYFEIFLKRMLMCRRAAEALSMHFSLVINEQKLL